MPRYLMSGYKGGGGACGGCCNDNTLDRNSAVFFNNLATKLFDMSKSIEKKMEELRNKVCEKPSGKGFLFASIEAPSMVVGIRVECLEYIKRYGPPPKGKFDETLLSKLREEMGIAMI